MKAIIVLATITAAMALAGMSLSAVWLAVTGDYAGAVVSGLAGAGAYFIGLRLDAALSRIDDQETNKGA